MRTNEMRNLGSRRCKNWDIRRLWDGNALMQRTGKRTEGESEWDEIGWEKRNEREGNKGRGRGRNW